VEKNIKIKYRYIDSINGDFNEEMTQSPVKLTGKFAKMILQDEEVIYLESWDLEEGGLINEITRTTINYTKGEYTTLRIRDMDICEKRIFVNNRSVDEKDLRVKSLFSYYQSVDIIIIVASDKVVVDTLEGISQTQLK
jgi:hypothetical protein